MAGRYVDNESENILIGWKNIARFLGVAFQTAIRWERDHGLPVARLPDGRVCTSKSLIDGWLLARSKVKAQLDKPETA